MIDLMYRASPKWQFTPFTYLAPVQNSCFLKIILASSENIEEKST